MNKLIQKWLSNYSLKYPQSLVYMLQASEYNLREYFRWLTKVEDFRFVARRGKLVATSKAKLLLAALWLVISSGAVISLFFLKELTASANWLWLISAGLIWLLLPPALRYLIIVPLWVGQFLIQKPKEYLIIRKAKNKLASLPALKIAIAGSYGKTTFKENLKTILSEGKKVAATIGNQNTPLGISRLIEKLDERVEIIIFELGEYYPGDIAKLCKIVRPDIGVITGVNEAHLEKFGNLKNTVSTIFELSAFVSPDNLYINGENALAKSRAKKLNHLFSRKGMDNWLVSGLQTSLWKTQFQLESQGRKRKIEFNLLGAHQVGPLLACIAIASRLGLSIEQILKGISKIKPFEHRMQPSYHPDKTVWIDDTYNGNPDGVKATLEFLQQLKGHRIIYVTPGLVEMGSRSKIIHLKIGRQLAKVADEVILIKNSVTPWIEEGLKKAGFKKSVIWFDDAISCYEALPNLTKSGDVVVLQNDWPDNYY